jgi:Ni/Fe-hydrogenase subunit HybB-like protein
MLPQILEGGSATWLLLLELGLFAWPLVLTRHQARFPTRGALMRVAMMILVAGSSYRLDATWINYSPGDEWVYFPSTPELLITFGVIAVPGTPQTEKS